MQEVWFQAFLLREQPSPSLSLNTDTLLRLLIVTPSICMLSLHFAPCSWTSLKKCARFLPARNICVNRKKESEEVHMCSWIDLLQSVSERFSVLKGAVYICRQSMYCISRTQNFASLAGRQPDGSCWMWVLSLWFQFGHFVDQPAWSCLIPPPCFLSLLNGFLLVNECESLICI